MERKIYKNKIVILFIIIKDFIPSKKLATNNTYTLAVNDFGDLYSWGSNLQGRLGHKLDGKNSEVIENAKKYDFFTNQYLKVLEVSCGVNHIAVVAISKNETQQDAGSVYTWGLTAYGRLGYIDDEDDLTDLADVELRTVQVPKALNIPDKVARIACGTDFCGCITVRGQLYTWGNNKSGYLGVENITYDSVQSPIVTTPTLVKSLVNKFIIQVVCGSKHMMCLTSERSVFSWGSGEDGILGHGNTHGVNKPLLIKELKNDDIIFIAASDFSSAAINNHGHLYTWGRGKYGILGHGSEENITLPRRVQDSAIENEKVFYISLGFYHALCCTGMVFIYILYF